MVSKSWVPGGVSVGAWRRAPACRPRRTVQCSAGARAIYAPATWARDAAGGAVIFLPRGNWNAIGVRRCAPGVGPLGEGRIGRIGVRCLTCDEPAVGAGSA